MRKIIIIFVFLFAIYSCRSQELYIAIDTRDTVNMWCRASSYKNPDYKKGERRIEYFIKREDNDIGMFYYGGGILLMYEPYSDAKLKQWTNIKKLRTVNISKREWQKIKKKTTSRVVDGIEWVHSTPWDTIYTQMHQYYFHREGMYVVDKKFASQDSVQIRGVDYIDIRVEE